MVRLFISFALLSLVAELPAQAQMSGIASVTDGDTLRIGPDRIRLHGIDAPESAQICSAGGKTWTCGEAATRALRERIAGRPLPVKSETATATGASSSCAGSQVPM